MNFLVVDEIYAYVGKKKQKVYVWTAIGWTPTQEKLVFYHVDHSKDADALARFDQTLPHVKKIYCDGNLAYPAHFGELACSGKGVETNLIESANSQFRQYVSTLHRKTKGYPKSIDHLIGMLAQVVLTKIL